VTSSLAILERSFRPIDVPTVFRSIGRVPFAGVYLQIKRNQIVYIGASIDVYRRLYMHGWKQRRSRVRRTANADRKSFDRAVWLPLPSSMLPFYEGALIRALTPKQNLDIPQTRCVHDAEILYSLGLHSDLTTDDIAWQEVA
jgi:hypothetical protein